MKLHYFWGIELAEIEHIYKKKDVSSFKKFLSNTVDPFRIPYDREIKEHPRACLLVATSNEQELLNDPTGSRRFFVVPVLKEIPIEELIRERDLIWAAANQLYQMGHQWWLTASEKELQAEANKDYQTSDPWEEKVLSFVRVRDWVTTYDILFTALGIETGRQDMMSQKRVASIMKINGWHKQRKWVDGHALQTWVRKLGKKVDQGGSRGSSQSEQGFEYDPPTESDVDQGGSRWITERTQEYNDNSVIHVIHLDPPIKSQVDQPESLDAPGLIHLDPRDPPILPNFPENNFVVQAEVTTNTGTKNDSSPITRPTKCRYYQIVKVDPTVFKIETGFGKVSVSAEPYHRLGTGDSKIWFEFQTPDGQTLTKSIKADPDQRLLPRVAKECGVIKKWEEKVIQHFSSKIENSVCKFKVRILGDDDYEWIEDCTLKSIPNPPTATHFIFTTPENAIVTSHFGEFEEM